MELFKTPGIGSKSSQTKPQESSHECCYKIYPILSSCSKKRNVSSFDEPGEYELVEYME